MLGLVLALALTQSSPQHRLFRQPNLPRQPLAFFEFANQAGTGMGSACACTTPTGAKGEAMTFTRASSGTCLKAGTTSGIANGDMVTCSTNQPRVMPGGDGTGGLGLLVEGARTNALLRSQELENAAYTWEQDTAPRTPTKTADQAVAPDGTTTAERGQFPATSGAQNSDFYQLVTVAGATDSWTCSLFVKGNASSGTSDLCRYNGAAWSCADCAFVSGSWTRCSIGGTGQTTTDRYCKFGNNSLQNGGVARSAVDVFLWGFQGEVGAFASSYIATTSAAVARAAEVAEFPISWPANSTGFSMSGSTPLASAGASNIRLHGSLFEGSLGAVPSANFVDSYGTATSTWTAEATAPPLNAIATYNSGISVGSAGAVARAATYFDPGAGLFNGCVNGTCGAGLAKTWNSAIAFTRIRLGAYDPTNGVIFSVTKRVCVQPNDPTRCR